ncbi:hypothetical protein TNCV_4753911 [Trichonephila clavipes]|nr:hypothetical protein TNCV_4753911 [Trichonephila clavipes]
MYSDMNADDLLHHENPLTWAEVEPANLGVQGQRQANYVPTPMGCRLLDTKGAQFEELAAYQDLAILNSSEDTYVSKTNGTESALDMTAKRFHSTENSR